MLELKMDFFGLIQMTSDYKQCGLKLISEYDLVKEEIIELLRRRI